MGWAQEGYNKEAFDNSSARAVGTITKIEKVVPASSNTRLYKKSW
jgi:hypothetical protein